MSFYQTDRHQPGPWGHSSDQFQEVLGKSGLGIFSVAFLTLLLFLELHIQFCLSIKKMLSELLVRSITRLFGLL